MLEPNYPNPFNESTAIAFKLTKPGHVTLTVYDMFGKEVARLIDNEYRNFGKYIEDFDTSGHNLAPGVYSFVLTGDGLSLRRKMLLVK